MVNIRSQRGERQQYRELILMMMNIEKKFAKPINSIYQKRYRDSASAVVTGNMVAASEKMLKYSSELKSVFEKFYRTTMVVFGGKLFRDVKPEKEFFSADFEYKGGIENEFMSNMRKWASEQATKKVKLISKNQAQRVANIIERGLEENLSHTVIAKEIEEKSAYTLWEALRTARTETHTCAVQSTQAATAAVTDLDWTKYWLSAMDDRTRPEHLQAGIDYSRDRAIDMDDEYQVGASSIMYPGDPDGEPEDVVNCRCVELYNAVNPDEARS